ncbi:MAG: hypothetical protein K2L81_02685 [Muribaculaceae bacterium]|nr:hypothetical protein [Muribaculaceae bacterium]
MSISTNENPAFREISDRMGKRLTYLVVFISIIVCAALGLVSCEKHDGVGYYHSKCEAELNGQYLIDQSRFDWGMGPGKTPHIIASEHQLQFESKLSTKRGEMPQLYLYISLYVDKPWEFLAKPQNIVYVDIDNIDAEVRPWDYSSYCDYQKINYAKIFLTSTGKTEFVEKGSFQITEISESENEHRSYKGKFNLQFSEGTLTGEFAVY